MFPSSRQIKIQAKITMAGSLSRWLIITVLFVVGNLVANYLVGGIGTPVAWYIADRPDLVSGITIKGDEIWVLSRFDMAGVVMGFLTSYTTLKRYCLFFGAAFLLLSPLKMGLLELYWKGFRGQEVSVKGVLNWYIKPGRFAKAVIVELIVGGGGWLLGILAAAPSVLFLISMGGFASGNTSLMSLVALIYYTLLFVGLLCGFYCYTLLLPLAYCLAAQPGYSLGKVVQRGFASVQGYRKKFFYFRLSMLPWNIISRLTGGMADMYIFPYLSFASLEFLQEVAKEKQKRAEAPTVDIRV